MNCEWPEDDIEDSEYPAPIEKFWLPRIYDRSRFDPEWYAKWAPPCPGARPQRMCEIVGFRLKGADYLQLRVILRDGDGGVCQMIVEEHDDVVFVHALACCDPEREAPRKGRARTPDRHETDCPCNVWLEAPLGERVVVNYENDEPLPLYIPRRGTDEPSELVPRPPGDLWPPSDASG